jgi:hypothetical protein
MTPEQFLKFAGLPITESAISKLSALKESVQVGDDISYTATDEQPPKTYAGRVTRLSGDGQTAEVQWTGGNFPKARGPYQTHWMRSTAQVNQDQTRNAADQAGREQDQATRQ